MQNPSTRFFFVAIFSLLIAGQTLAQSIISGIINDDANKPLPGITVLLKGTNIGTSTNSSGEFKITTSHRFPVTVLLSAVGFEGREVIIEDEKPVVFSIKENFNRLNEVVVTASRSAEAISKSPVTIETLTSRQIAESAAPSAYDAISTLKGVNTLNTSLLFTVYNTRGFQHPTNVRFVQLVDGVDNQSPVLNFPIANTIGAGELDIESAELIPGASSAQYGLSASNGLLNFITKNPFLYEGLSASYKVGVNNVNSPFKNQAGIKSAGYENFSLRYAKAFNSRFAFKLNFQYIKGQDWASGDVSAQSNSNRGRFSPDPGYDGVNLYGDENIAIPALLGPASGKPAIAYLSRTGYAEHDLTDYDSKLLRGDVTLAYKINENSQLSYTYRGGIVDNIFTRSNKLKFKDYAVQQHVLQFNSPVVSYKGYVSTENSGDSYNIRYLADNLNRIAKPNAQWQAEFGAAYGAAIRAGQTVNAALVSARAAADVGRILPGSDTFESTIASIKNDDSWKTGAKFTSKGYLIHNELLFDFSKYTSKIVNVQIGGDYRYNRLNSNGSFYPDTAGNKVYNYKYGAFLQLHRDIIQDKLKVTGSVRYDKQYGFDGQFTGRAGLVFSPNEKSSFRISYQNGFRLPVFQEAWMFVNAPTGQGVGGARKNAESLGIVDNNYLVSSIVSAVDSVYSKILKGQTQAQAVASSAGVLQKGKFGYLKPEQNSTWEIGYKGSFLDDRLFFDINAYYVQYKGFITSYTVAKPTGGITNNLTDIQKILGGAIAGYQFITNSNSKVFNYGTSVNLDYRLPQNFILSGNFNYTDFDQDKTPDEELSSGGFNTPKVNVNVNLGKRNAWKNLGFNVAYKWTDKTIWISDISKGTVPSWQTVDAQVTYSVPSIKSSIRLGASNVFNKYYTQFRGGPSIGGIYYVSITYDDLFR